MFTPEKDFFNSWHAKFETFQKRNAVDLKHLKVKAMLDQNYEKCDEFYKYEKYLYSAYHKELLTYTKQLTALRTNLQKDEWVKSYFESQTDTGYEDVAKSEERKDSNYERTEDLVVWTAKYPSMPDRENLSTEWKFDPEFTDSKEKEDPVFGYLKFLDTSNYKPGVINTLGVFESERALELFKAVNVQSALLMPKQDVDLQKAEKAAEIIDIKIAQLTQELHNSAAYLHYESLTEDFISVFTAIKGLNQLNIIARHLKEFKSDPELFQSELSKVESEISSLITNFTSTFANLDSSHSPETNGMRLVSFLCQFVFPLLSLSLHSLKNVVNALSPKKKKKDSPIVLIFNNPLKDMLKNLKEWLGELIVYYQRNEGEEIFKKGTHLADEGLGIDVEKFLKDIVQDKVGGERVVASTVENTLALFKGLSYA